MSEQPSERAGAHAADGVVAGGSPAPVPAAGRSPAPAHRGWLIAALVAAVVVLVASMALAVLAVGPSAPFAGERGPGASRCWADSDDDGGGIACEPPGRGPGWRGEDAPPGMMRGWND